MALTISGSAQSFSTTTTGTIVVPGTVAAGDLMILQAVGGWNPSVPAGWTNLSSYAGTNVQYFVATKTAVSGDIGSTINVTWSNAYNSVLNLIAVNGGSGLRTPARHLWASGGGTGTPSTQDAAPGDMAVYIGGNRSDGGAPTLSRGTVDVTGADGSIVAAGVIGHELITTRLPLTCTFTAPSSGNGYEYSVLVVSGGATLPANKYSPTILADSPLAYWKLDESIGVPFADSSGNNRSATVSGTATSDTTSFINVSAMTFDGADYGYISSPSWFANMTAFSVEGWFKTGYAPNSGIIICIDDTGQAPGSATRLFRFYVNSSGQVMLFVSNSTGTYVEFGGPRNYLDNNWHHAVGTYDGANVKIYVDGVMTASQALTGALASGTGSYLVIGNGQLTSLGNIQQYMGDLDEIAVYGSALSQARIQAHYAASGVFTAGSWLFRA